MLFSATVHHYCSCVCFLMCVFSDFFKIKIKEGLIINLFTLFFLFNPHKSGCKNLVLHTCAQITILLQLEKIVRAKIPVSSATHPG